MKSEPVRQRVQVNMCDLARIKHLMEIYHYSKSVFGVTITYCFEVLLDGALVGGAIFGLP